MGSGEKHLFYQKARERQRMKAGTCRMPRIVPVCALYQLKRAEIQIFEEKCVLQRKENSLALS